MTVTPDGPYPLPPPLLLIPLLLRLCDQGLHVITRLHHVGDFPRKRVDDAAASVAASTVPDVFS